MVRKHRLVRLRHFPTARRVVAVGGQSRDRSMAFVITDAQLVAVIARIQSSLGAEAVQAYLSCESTDRRSLLSLTWPRLRAAGSGDLFVLLRGA